MREPNRIECIFSLGAGDNSHSRRKLRPTTCVAPKPLMDSAGSAQT
jgi:hypothetical protein